MNDEQWQVITGDCLEVMRGMDAGSVDAVITDPPYGLSFMGKEWDHGVPGVHFWQEALRVAKPGAMMLAFGGTRTFHRLAVAIEDAGWEIRDTVMWLYGSGFPKSHDVSKAIDRAAGAEREVVGRRVNGNGGGGAKTYDDDAYVWRREVDITAPATPDAARWQGWGTALKPAWEPVIMARKPLTGTVAQNVLEWGTGGINVDGCRVGTEGGGTVCNRRDANGNCMGHPAANGSLGGGVMRHGPVVGSPGRWPSNLIHDGSDEVLAGFPVTSSGAQNGAHIANWHDGNGPRYKGNDTGNEFPASTSSAARFFYAAKASKADREEGLEGFDAIHRVNGNKWTDQDYRVARGERPPAAESGPRRNHHPTVKPTSLMRYLCRLVTPPGGVILDMFAGSGSTGKAAMMEGFRFIGVELSEEYADIARARIAKAAEQARQLTLGIEQAA